MVMVNEHQDYAKEFGLHILCKAPVPGLAKSRLSREVGVDNAMKMYGSILEYLFARLGEWPQVNLHIEPWEHRGLLEKIVPGHWDWAPQAEGDLGNRIVEPLAESQCQGMKGGIVIGSDTPDIGIGDMESACRLLRSHAAVFGPSTDGGYWLCGVQFFPGWQSLFSHIPWSTGSTLVETLSIAASLPIGPVALLDYKTDLDTAQDWDMIQKALNLELKR